jgi:DNA-binding CsgD family transcriptional regulator
MATVFRSGDALMAFGPDLRVDAWNDELESLTGIPAAEAIGRPCWEVLAGLDERGGAVICHPGCAAARLALEGWPVPSRSILIRTAEGRKLLTMSTIAAVNADRDAVGLHLFRPAADAASEPEPAAESHLTARQHEVLELVAAGATAKAIATDLGVAEVTVRSHIRAILLQLGCHSQVEALAEARRRRLLAP